MHTAVRLAAFATVLVACGGSPGRGADDGDPASSTDFVADAIQRCSSSLPYYGAVAILQQTSSAQRAAVAAFGTTPCPADAACDGVAAGACCYGASTPEDLATAPAGGVSAGDIALSDGGAGLATLPYGTDLPGGYSARQQRDARSAVEAGRRAAGDRLGRVGRRRRVRRLDRGSGRADGARRGTVAEPGDVRVPLSGLRGALDAERGRHPVAHAPGGGRRGIAVRIDHLPRASDRWGGDGSGEPAGGSASAPGPTARSLCKRATRAPRRAPTRPSRSTCPTWSQMGMALYRP